MKDALFRSIKYIMLILGLILLVNAGVAFWFHYVIDGVFSLGGAIATLCIIAPSMFKFEASLDDLEKQIEKLK